MPICQKCNQNFPNRKFIDGKERLLHNRKYCLECSPLFSRKFTGPKTQLDENGNKILVKGILRKYNCKICNKEFYNKNAAHECPTCRNKKVRNKRKEYALEYKGGCCCKCGYNKCHKALTFHHINPEEKDMTLSANWEKSFDRVKKELDKCILLCANCHAELHADLWNIGSLEIKTK